MTTKSCPSCGADVPSVAKRCRECFHDFRPNQEQTSGSNVALMLLGFFGVMAVLGAVTLGAITAFPIEQKIQVHQETGYIITTTQYVSGVKTDRIAFKEIERIEHIVVGNGTFEVIAHKRGGGTKLISRSKKSRKTDAQTYADVMGKPFFETDNSRTGFNFQRAE